LFLKSDHRNVRRRMKSPEVDGEAAMSQASPLPVSPPSSSSNPSMSSPPRPNGLGSANTSPNNNTNNGHSANNNGNGHPRNVTIVNTLHFPPSADAIQNQNSFGLPSSSASTPSQPSRTPSSGYSRADADPFGYLNTTSTGVSAPPTTTHAQSNYPHTFPATAAAALPSAPPPPRTLSDGSSASGSGSSTSQSVTTTLAAASAGTASSRLVANPRLPAAHLSTSAHALPIHPVAYVAFGAGARQKSIDIHCATHPLEGTGLAGQSEGIPYHVPV
jgi:DNA segregation ATPase FtsK/SpoIIIE, S-DNA-T family